MSVGDSAFQIATLGPAGSWVMGANAASQQARDVILRGGSNRQAFWSGLAAGAAEKIFERFSIDSLLSQKTVTGVKSLLKETAKQAGVEAGEEMLTEVSNILSDTIIMGKNSEFERLVDWYMGEELLTEEEARERAFFDSIGRVFQAGLGGALSGGTMGGVKAGIDYRSAGRRNEQPKQAQGEKKEVEIHLADPEGRGYNNRGVPLPEDEGWNEREEAETGNTTDAEVLDGKMAAAQDEGDTESDEFSIDDWTGYPDGPKPDGPFRMLEGTEYNEVRQLANKTNNEIHRRRPDIKGLEIHEIHPVKFGGSPTDMDNKIFLLPKEHRKYTAFWNKIMRDKKKGH